MSAAPFTPSAARAALAQQTDYAQAPGAQRMASTQPAQLHRPFFLAALALVLTLGATWGATLLWRIGLGGSFTAAGAHEVNAHGLAQIYGWVGLFIMGFAYTVFPRMWRSPAPSRTLATLALTANVAGVLVSALGMRLSGTWAAAAPVALLGSGMIILGVTIFAAQILNAFERRRVAAEPAFLFMLVAIAWFVLSTVFSAVHTWMTLTAGNHDRLVEVISTYQAALRDVQVHGMALTMILGVSMKMLPGMFGLQRISHRRAMIALGLITLGVAGETSFFIAFRWTSMPMLAGVLYLCWAMLAAGVATTVLAWRPCFGLPRDDGRSGKFIRAAYIWLTISLVMLLLLPLYQMLVGVPFSHAYYGAARHAITVGFVSLMIMGVAGKFVPALRGIPWRDLSSLRGPFILVNAGCALRVILQTATDFHPMAFTLVGVSSVLEVGGLGWWGLDLARHMLRRRESADAASDLPILQTAEARQHHIGIDATRASVQQRRAVDAVAERRACCSMCAGHSHAPSSLASHQKND
jgi:hypothetical protein